MKGYFIYIFLFIAMIFKAQTQAPEKIKIKKETEEPIFFAETQPEFPGGYIAMARFVSQNIQFSDSIDQAMCVAVSINFVVNIDGSLSDIKILRCSPECKACREETIRVIKLMPKWKPGIYNGKPIAVTFNIPIRFALK